MLTSLIEKNFPSTTLRYKRVYENLKKKNEPSVIVWKTDRQMGKEEQIKTPVFQWDEKIALITCIMHEES